MGRIGFDGIDESFSKISEIIEVCNLQNLMHEGIFTHFAKADHGNNSREFTLKQFERFTKTVELLKEKGIEFKLKHCSNSAAIIDYPEFSLDMVRPGIILYGLKPSETLVNEIELLPVMKLKTVISHIKEVEANTPISYGSEYITTKKQRIATLPIGYADGLWRSNFTNKTCILINNELAPIIGKICMDQTMVDVTNVFSAKVGNEVTIFGDNNGLISADSLAQRNNSIGYEIVCSVSKRVPRIYIH
jgi:alanine racemase